MQKWQYQVVELPAEPEQLVEELNLHGDNGWEYIEAWPKDEQTRVVVFKRRAPGLPQC